MHSPAIVVASATSQTRPHPNPYHPLQPKPHPNPHHMPSLYAPNPYHILSPTICPRYTLPTLTLRSHQTNGDNNKHAPGHRPSRCQSAPNPNQPLPYAPTIPSPHPNPHDTPNASQPQYQTNSNKQ